MKPDKKHRGVIVPIVTPVRTNGQLDEVAARRIIDFLLDGGVHGVFVLGTTGEAASVPRRWRLRYLELVREHVAGRALVYAGLNDNCLADTIEAANEFLRAGADAVVALLPSYFAIQPPEMLRYFEELLDQVSGPVIIYNMPATTHLSIPINVLEKLATHPRLIGLKDSENDETRQAELLARLGGRKDFSIFVGVGTLMGKMLLRGADGIVPSAGNLVPDVCRKLWEAAANRQCDAVEQWEKRMLAVAMIYQRGRTLGQSLAALKAAMSLKGLCEPAMLPPLLALNDAEQQTIRQEMVQLGLLG